MALGGFVIERVVGVLAVDVDQLLADVFELGEGGSLVVDKAAAAAFGVDNPAQAQFGGVFVQQPLIAQLGCQIGQGGKVEQGRQARFFGAGAHLGVIGFVAQEQADGIKGNRFAGAGFAGEHGKAALEIEIEFFNQDKVLQRQCEQHETKVLEQCGKTVFRLPSDKGSLKKSKQLEYEENQRVQHKQRHQYAEGPGQIAEEAGHRHFALLGNRFDHKVRRITDIA